MRTGLRVLAFLLAIPLLLGGIAGVVLARGGDTFTAQWKARAKVEAAASRGADSSGSALDAGLDGAEALRAPVLHFGMLGARDRAGRLRLSPPRARRRTRRKRREEAAKGAKKAATPADARGDRQRARVRSRRTVGQGVASAT